MTVPFRVSSLPSDPASRAAAMALYEAAHALECHWLGGYPLPRLWQQTDDIAADGQQVWAASDDAGRLCGVLVARWLPQAVLDIERLLVDPARLGEGWAGRLLTVALQDARVAQVQTAAANVAARRCYAKAGFVEGRHWHTADGLPLLAMGWQRDDTPLALQLDEAGWVCEAEAIPSPNCDAYAAPGDTPLLLLHNISLPPYRYGGDGVAALFTNTLDAAADPYYAGIAHLRVSCHFFIRRDGRLLQFVPVTQRAWHAGVSQWRGRERCNDFSLGIELEGCDFEPFSHAQYRMLGSLVALLQARCGVQAITGHEHVAPGRKTDPGPYFDWARLARAVGRPLPEN